MGDFPPPIRTFLIRSLVLFVVWKSCYLFFWMGNRTLDKPLTQMVGNQSAAALNLMHPLDSFTATPKVAVMRMEGEYQLSKVSTINRNGKSIMHIADNCNGLELFVLYLGFILAMPAPINRKIVFSVLGILLIHVVNILRCVGLTSLLLHWDRYFDFAHHYIFKVVVYATIFAMWIWFAKPLNFKSS